MAEVFKCRLDGIGGFDKTVVLKCILEQHLDNREFVQMFLDEARVAARLSHPNIVQTFEIGQLEEIPYIAMEYVPGPSLATVNARARKEKALHPGHAARMIAGACQGLYHAHNARDSQGQPLDLVHRDVSPQNIVISSEGIPKLLDFGVAKTRGRLVATQHGMLKGKFGYMSPEQLEGEAVDFRSDIFSIGVCLYLCTVGKLPFRGSSEVEVIAAGRKAVYVRPSEVVPGFPPEMEEIIVTALQRDPAQRFPNARVMAERLEAFAASGSYASSADGLMEWLTALFPEGLENTGEHELRPGISTPSGKVGPGVASGSKKSPRSLSGFSLETGPRRSAVSARGGRRRGALLAAGMAAFVLLAGVVGLVTWKSGDSSKAEAARTYLAGAEQMLEDRKIELARNLVERAESAGATDPELNVQIGRIRDQVELEEALDDTRHALDASDPTLALKRARDVLERHPGHAEGKWLMEEALRRLSSEPAPPSTPAVEAAAEATTSPVSRVPGSLSISSTPPGDVFIDGLSAGRAPVKIAQILPGTHLIEIRRAGFPTVHREVILAPGEEESLRVSLSRTGSRSMEDSGGSDTVVASASQPPAATGPAIAVTASTPPGSTVPLESKPPITLPLPPPPVISKPPVTLPLPPPPEIKTSGGGAATGAAAQGSPAPGGDATKASPPVAARPADMLHLPRTARVRTMSEILRAFQAIESEAIRGGAPASVARDSTRALSTELGRRMTAADTTEVYPRAMYSLIVEEAARGASSSAIGEKLKNAHLSGALKSR